MRAAAARGLVKYQTRIVFPTLDPDPSAWAWTVAEPPAGWREAGFDDSAWKRSAGGFGNVAITRDHGAKVATEWNTKTLWLRRHFSFDGDPEKILAATFDMFHDEDVELWLNGKPIVEAGGYTTGYAPCSPPIERFAAAVRRGDNVLAARVRQTVGGQYFDTGLSVDLAADDCGVQFSHTLTEQIGGQLAAGFTLLDLYEDTNGEGRLHALNIPTFLAMRARKPEAGAESIRR